jgi:hypothetical protein
MTDRMADRLPQARDVEHARQRVEARALRECASSIRRWWRDGCREVTFEAARVGDIGQHAQVPGEAPSIMSLVMRQCASQRRPSGRSHVRSSSARPSAASAASAAALNASGASRPRASKHGTAHADAARPTARPRFQ